MELILGLPPMTPFDLMANPMTDAFHSTPDWCNRVAYPTGNLLRIPMNDDAREALFVLSEVIRHRAQNQCTGKHCSCDAA
jgi:hypothetical protein